MTFALAIGSYWDSRNLAFGAGQAVAFGLDKEQALAAVTLNAAKSQVLMTSWVLWKWAKPLLWWCLKATFWITAAAKSVRCGLTAVLLI